jgi:putative oxidoreductase
MKQLAIIGRILFAIPIIAIGLSHFLMTPEFLTKLEHSLIPGSMYTVLLSGAMLIIASVFIILNKYVKIACLWLAGMLFVIITTIHIPNLFYPELFNLSLMETLQDTALLGASLMIAYYLENKKAE